MLSLRGNTHVQYKGGLLRNVVRRPPVQHSPVSRYDGDRYVQAQVVYFRQPGVASADIQMAVCPPILLRQHDDDRPDRPCKRQYAQRLDMDVLPRPGSAWNTGCNYYDVGSQGSTSASRSVRAHIASEWRHRSTAERHAQVERSRRSGPLPRSDLIVAIVRFAGRRRYGDEHIRSCEWAEPAHDVLLARGGFGPLWRERLSVPAR